MAIRLFKTVGVAIKLCFFKIELVFYSYSNVKSQNTGMLNVFFRNTFVKNKLQDEDSKEFKTINNSYNCSIV